MTSDFMWLEVDLDAGSGPPCIFSSGGLDFHCWRSKSGLNRSLGATSRLHHPLFSYFVDEKEGTTAVLDHGCDDAAACLPSTRRSLMRPSLSPDGH
ncbi:hypothetical protein E2562_034362 [Oryza meyeriana var. granulata]|uniref:Uncharacterized protein n=1 Tax=Oryza meyeriana var. granulata TaxID=110450 RepID=A0A6G1FFJ5_9ORYZ|nr:hypothetical protein E2562_034362 [Oryza meyeriana var. granulata]